MRREKKLQKRISEDVATLKVDIRRVRDDLARRIRARRQGARTVVVAGGPEARETITEVREEAVRPEEYAARPRRHYWVLTIRRHPRWVSVLGAFLALGTIAILLTRRREVAVAEAPQPRRWRRLGVLLPWRRRSRRVVIRTEEYQPAVPGASPGEHEVTVERAESPVG